MRLFSYASEQHDAMVMATRTVFRVRLFQSPLRHEVVSEKVTATVVIAMNLPLVLLVDDEVGVRESLKMVLGKDYRLLEADSVDAAMPKVLENRPDLVLLDILMPKTDGIEVLRRIKEIHPGCAVIMMTGLNSQQVAAKAMNFGAFDFIGKPFDVAELRQKVSRALEQRLTKPD